MVKHRPTGGRTPQRPPPGSAPDSCYAMPIGILSYLRNITELVPCPPAHNNNDDDDTNIPIQNHPVS